ncbi:hypothetical protein MPH_02075 [Macrophomina phaseolina MS6]|uniref:Uncharacterized protein n=1 Tax=Macrophomina phaseolina (strain MS6) TaxID=1126212 RepID=K2S0S4_MACPH|nr:hypothetical protein MPH_02075 [Macrophomina phaseolina MS6]
MLAEYGAKTAKFPAAFVLSVLSGYQQPADYPVNLFKPIPNAESSTIQQISNLHSSISIRLYVALSYTPNRMWTYSFEASSANDLPDPLPTPSGYQTY